VSAEPQDCTKGYGSLRSVKIEYHVEFADTMVTFTPTIGQRRVSGGSVTAFLADATIYHDWSDMISAHSRIYRRGSAGIRQSRPRARHERQGRR
jgi:hypothetical protein